jgi:hypothetical protein
VRGSHQFVVAMPHTTERDDDRRGDATAGPLPDSEL